MSIPYLPTIAEQPVYASTQLIQGTPPAAIVASVTLTTPTSPTLITGLTQQVFIQPGTNFLMIKVVGKNATVTAAATLTVGAYTGATSGALTTLFQDHVSVAATGGTTTGVDHTFILPIAGSLWNTSTWISIAATSSSGNYVLNAAATEPTIMLVMAA